VLRAVGVPLAVVVPVRLMALVDVALGVQALPPVLWPVPVDGSAGERTSPRTVVSARGVPG